MAAEADRPEPIARRPVTGALRRIRYVDLSLGAWRPFEAAWQLAVDLELEPRAAPGADSAEPMAVGPDAVDRDYAGDTAVSAAHEEAVRIAGHLPTGTVIAVFTPRYDLPVRAENEWFFLFLRRNGVSVALIGDEPPAKAVTSPPFERRRGIAGPNWSGWPQQCDDAQARLLRFFPGILPRALAERFGVTASAFGLVPCGPSHLIIPPDYRDRDPRASAAEIDMMGEVEAEDAGFHAFGQIWCNAYFADAEALAARGRQCFAAGAVDIAGALLARARSVARTPAAVALTTADLQAFHLRAHRFDEAATAVDPSPRAPPELAARIVWMRGLGAALAGDTAAAERDFADALARLEAGETLSAEALYGLDALARARLKASDVNDAAALAEAITEALDADADRRIVFRNAMTRAAIDRRRMNSDRHRAMVQRAFATGRGARTLGEIVHLNVAEARVETNPYAPEAGQAWLRAAFAWLALEPSESLAWPAAAAILERDRFRRPQLDTEISDALTAALRKAWPDVMPREQTRLPAIRLADKPPPVQPHTLFAGLGIGVMWTRELVAGPIYAPARSRLIRMALAALARICPASAEIESGTLIVDTNLGFDLPRTRAEAASIALRLGVERFVFGADVVAMKEAGRRFHADLNIRLSPVVAGIVPGEGGSVVRFARHLSPLPLSAEDAELIRPLADRERRSLTALTMEARLPGDVVEASLRRLELARVVRVEVVPRSASLNEDRHAVRTAG